MKDENKVLLHACCAICSGYPIQHLRDLGHEPIVYFFNPNIYPEIEHEKRLNAQKTLCDSMNCELIVEDYAPESYKDFMVGYENYGEKSERCHKCFEIRLLKTVQKAKVLGINKFTTSISISPHKNFKALKEVGAFCAESDVMFLDIDFKKQDGFLKTNKIAKDLNLYRQNYCGCEVSMKWLKDLK